MVDKALVLRKIEQLKTYGSQISEYRETSLQAYSSDWRIQRVVERTLQIMIETCVDIANHIISDEGLRVPETYSDSFKVLLEKGIISEHLHYTMDRMAKFRNIVVHQYQTVDGGVVISILEKNLGDFDAFADAVISHLKGGA